MNKTVNANIGGLIFHVDEDAYQKLHSYLMLLKRHFSRMEGEEEIVTDIEARIAEMLKERLDERQIVNNADVDHVIERMGRPEDFEDPLSEGQETGAGRQETPYSDKRFYRNPDDSVLGGVCSGISAYLGMDPLWLRLAFVGAVIFGFGSGILIYFILWIIIPEANTTAEKLRMRGEPVNVNNIERKIREEAEDLKQRWSNFSNSNQFGKWQYRGRGFGNDFANFIKDLFGVFGKVVGVILIIVGLILLFTFFWLYSALPRLLA